MNMGVKMNNNIYTQKITLKALLVFTIPTMLMVLIQSSYSMIDGVFISNILGDRALSSLTLISPYFNFFMAIATMFSAGGSAIVMKKMGEQKQEEAKENLTMLLVVSTLIGAALTVLTMSLSEELVAVFQTTKQVQAFSEEYLFAYSFFIIPQLLLSNLLVYTIAQGKATLAMGSSIFGGVFNIVFDYILIYKMNLGMSGAAIASGFGMLIPCLILARGFVSHKNMLHFVRPTFDRKVLFKTMTNGFSEFSSYLVSGVVMILFNAQMLRIGGESGVAASTITFYVFGLMSGLYMGYMLGISPLLSYFYGANQQTKMKKIRKLSFLFIGAVGIITTLLSALGSELLVNIFTDPKSPAYAVAITGNRLFSLALLFVGFNTFSSMLFTALSNGKISAIISFSRTFIFLVGTIIVLPIIFGINGLWLAVPVSEILALIVSAIFFYKYREKYGY